MILWLKYQSEDRYRTFPPRPCPFCGTAVPELKEERARVGLWRFACEIISDSPGTIEKLLAWLPRLRSQSGEKKARRARISFMPIACCINKIHERQERLDSHPPEIMYHMTSSEFALKILEGGGKFLRGREGEAGAAIYFAFTPRECEWKAEVEEFWPGVVVLEVLVWKGRSKQVLYKDEAITFQTLVAEGYDSVLLDRNCERELQLRDDALKAGIVGAEKMPAVQLAAALQTPLMIPGNEVAVYSWDQVRVLRLVDRDPVPR